MAVIFSSMKKNKAIFLDRDGVINASPGQGFVTNWRDFRFLPGTLPALKRLRGSSYKIIIISNQSAVGRNLMALKTLRQITRKMLTAIRKAGGRMDAVYYCPHHPEDGCGCHKPKMGLLKKAARDFSIDLTESFMIGDSRIDIRMGKKAGCATLLVLSGKESHRSLASLRLPADQVFGNLLQAIRWILRRKTAPSA